MPSWRTGVYSSGATLHNLRFRTPNEPVDMSTGTPTQAQLSR
jgi:hypothetical protein